MPSIQPTCPASCNPGKSRHLLQFASNCRYDRTIIEPRGNPMALVSFTPNLQRHIDCPDVAATGTTLRDVLAETFAHNPAARSYVLDDQEALRKHVVIFIDGEPVRDRTKLTDPVQPDSEIFVMQALSGG